MGLLLIEAAGSEKPGSDGSLKNSIDEEDQ
jgi:hypothetical protein